jgi:CheY-like chemotaxis protein
MFSSTLNFAARSHPLSVLVADDMVEIQQLVKRWLVDVGCDVTCASTGKEVAKLTSERQFDVLITDVLMPEGDGLEVIAAVKRAQPLLRVLAISGGGNHLPAHDCLRFARGLGAHGVLLKPFSREQLLEQVTQVTMGGETGAAGASGV